MSSRLRVAALAAGIGLLVVPSAEALARPLVGGLQDAASDAPVPAVPAPIVPVPAQTGHQHQYLAPTAAGGNASAMVNLASRLEYGDDTHGQDRAAAFDLYERAADNGNPVGLQKMCVAYILGEGRPKDISRGMTYCNKLDTKDGVALWAEGYDYQYGISGPKDIDAAMTLYAQAVEAGSGEAADALGHQALVLGKPDIARKWFRHGVYRGSADAMDDLAGMVESGQGGVEDKPEAAWLYVSAAWRGNADAAGKVAAMPAGEGHPRHISLRAGKTLTAITETYTDKSGAPKTIALDVNELGRRLQGFFPGKAIGSYVVEGSATVECYVAADHSVDACFVPQEFPPGYDFGRVLQEIYDGRLTVAEQDALGLPTADTEFLIKLIFTTS